MTKEGKTVTWTAGWTQALTDVSAMQKSFENVTLRMRPTATIAGEGLRFELKNEFGTDPVVVGHAAVTVGGRTLSATFDGNAQATIPVGGSIRCDGIPLPVEEDDDVQIDIFLPDWTRHTSGNVFGSAFEVSGPGDHAGAADFPAGAPAVLDVQGQRIALSAPFLSSLDVADARPDAVVVCFGDSITVMGWPAIAANLTRGVAVLNRGLAGNRLRFDAPAVMATFGLSGLKRFDVDVLATSGATHVVIALGTNDLGHPGVVAALDELPTADDLISGYQELIGRATAAGLSAIITTITPFMPAPGYDDDREGIRLRVNDWIRSSAPRFVDFDAALRSEDDPSRLRSDDDSGDHLHPSEAGQVRLGQAMAEAIAEWIR
jgi:lysophospholipase L1-like esterase